ncbi:N-acetyltransferase [Pediococcus damnosus]|nr:N-acetyltransferase [Pediococcus damnosus]
MDRMVERPVDKKIKTPRLNLRPFVSGDLFKLQEIVENKEIADQAGFRVSSSSFETDFFLQQLMRTNIWAITLKQSAAVIGSIGLYSVSNEHQERDFQKFEIGYMMNQDFWGQGYMKEAVSYLLQQVFQTNGDYVVLASTYTENKRSKLLLEHLGFKQTGQHTLPVSVLNPAPKQETYYELTERRFKEGGNYATH